MARKRFDHLRVFISSPSDVQNFRLCCEKVIEDINRLYAHSISLQLDIVRFEQNIVPNMGRPQGVINDQARIADCDVFVGILGARFGSPTGAMRPDGLTPFESGTEEEFYIAYSNWQRARSPRILIYRNVGFSGDLTSIDGEQFRKVDKFFQDFKQDGVNPGLIKHVRSEDEFQEAFSSDMASVARELSEKRVPDEEALKLNEPYASLGISKLFLPAHNHFREDEKRRLILESRKLHLVANSGHSFLALVGHRYRNQIETLLRSGGILDVTLLNPWSETGLAIASQETASVDAPAKNLFDYRVNPEVVDQIISNSKWYGVKFRDSLEGIEALFADFPEQFRVHIASFPMTSTILLSEAAGFFEPYTHIGTKDRFRAGMLVAEIFFEKDSYLHDFCMSYVESIQDCAIPIDEFRSKEQEYRQRFISRFGA